MKAHTWPIRVYYEDTDAGGVVYHASYVRFFERGRTEFVRQLGFEQDSLLQQGIVFAVRKMSIDFKAPALFNQALQVLTEVKQIKAASLIFEQRIVSDDPQQLYCQAQVQVACIQHTSFKPCALPEDFTGALRDHE